MINTNSALCAFMHEGSSSLGMREGQDKILRLHNTVCELEFFPWFSLFCSKMIIMQFEYDTYQIYIVINKWKPQTWFCMDIPCTNSGWCIKFKVIGYKRLSYIFTTVTLFFVFSNHLLLYVQVFLPPVHLHGVVLS